MIDGAELVEFTDNGDVVKRTRTQAWAALNDEHPIVIEATLPDKGMLSRAVLIPLPGILEQVASWLEENGQADQGFIEQLRKLATSFK